MEEQQKIVDLISVETTAIDTAIGRTEREISLMLEFRTRLTADLVTGKLDVREAASISPNSQDDDATEPISDEPFEYIENEEALT